MKKHIWKKSFSISFVFHFIVVITIGAMVAGFHQEIQRPKEELITVNLADTPEQRAKAQEKSSFNSFSRDCFLGIRVQKLVYQAGLSHTAMCGKGA